jgi:hypothetical protein
VRTEVTAEACAVMTGAAAALCRAAAATPAGVVDAVTGAAQSAAEQSLAAIASSFANAGAFFLGKLGSALTSTTEIDVSSGWFLERYAVMFGLSAVLTLALLVLSVMKAVVRGSAAEAVRSGTVYYLAAVVCSAFAPAVVYLLVRLSDEVSAALLAASGDDLGRLLDGTGTALATLTVAAPAAGPAAALIAGVFTILCAGILWLELLLRTAVVYVSLLFAAPTFSGLVDRSLWRHSRRWLTFTVSVIFAKPVVVAVLSLAAAGTSSGTQDGFTSVFVGLALLVIAIFCVGLLFRLVPNAADEMVGVLNARREVNAATPHSPLPAPSTVVKQSVQSHLVRSATTRAAAVSGGAAVAAPIAASAVAGGVHRVVQQPVKAAGRATAAAGGPR